MSYDISESVSQRGSGEETAENRRIHEVTDELYRRCQLYEAQLRDSQDDVNHLDVEQRVAELYAKENGMWLPMSNVFDLGVPGPSGNENDTYVSNDIIYKVNRPKCCPLNPKIHSLFGNLKYSLYLCSVFKRLMTL